MVLSSRELSHRHGGGDRLRLAPGPCLSMTVLVTAVQLLPDRTFVQLLLYNRGPLLLVTGPADGNGVEQNTENF